MSNENVRTFAEGQARLANVISRLNEWVYGRPASIPPDRECTRCGYEDCICGTPEFEEFVSQALDAAAAIEVES